MNWTEKQKNQIQKESKKYIENAIDDFEAAVILLENEKFRHSCQLLQNSARALMDGYFVIHGMALPGEDQKRINQFSELNQSEVLVKEKLEEVFTQILVFDLTLLHDKQQIRQYDLLSEQYRDLIYQLQRRYNQLLKNELATLKDQEQFALHRKQFRRRLVVSIMLVGIIFAGLYWRYLVLQPLHEFHDQGQIFWSSENRKDFSESFQEKFPVRIDGNFAEYQISFRNPAKINKIRLDPLTRQITQWDIDFIELSNPEGELVYSFNFGPEDQPWTRVNVSGDEKGNGVWELHPQNHDPFIISTVFPEYEVGAVKIRMRLLNYLPFWNWLFGQKS
ncbi:MAG: hypothetical protein HQM13_15960 [SAR324 cluster bacterium]|nr:hypothetical protein [SAR324 cluster bacterium]